MGKLEIIAIIIILAVLVRIITGGKKCYYCGDRLSKEPLYSLGHYSCLKCAISNDKVVNSAKHK